MEAGDPERAHAAFLDVVASDQRPAQGLMRAAGLGEAVPTELLLEIQLESAG